MEYLQKYIVESDNFHINILKKGYWLAYAKKTIERVRNENGIAYCAFLDDDLIGFIAGVIEEAEPERPDDPLQEYVSEKSGEIIELIVLPESRGTWIGRMLMQQMEKFFLEKECKFSSLQVFGPNGIARDFYEKWGYTERMITMIKPL